MKKLFIERAEIRPPRKLEEADSSTQQTEDGLWTAEVWRLDEVNLNGRIYSTELAQRIVALSPVTTANDGHNADYAQEYAAAKAICKDPYIEQGLLKCHVKFIDEDYEKKLEKLAEEGVPIGCSSVGWGECDEDGRIVPETYELVRYLDFVTQPAGEVHVKKNESEQHEEEMSDRVPSAVAEALAKKITRIITNRRNQK